MRLRPIMVIGQAFLTIAAAPAAIPAERPVVRWELRVESCAGKRCHEVRRDLGGRWECQVKQAAILEAVPGTPGWILGHPGETDVTVKVACDEIRGDLRT